VKHLRAWAVAWVTFWWLWMLLVGEWNRDEWIAAACTATVAATLTEVVRTRAGVRAPVPVRRLVRPLLSVPSIVLVDFALVMWALVHRREGVFRTYEPPRKGRDPTSVGVRTWFSFVANISPNAYVVDIDAERAVLHDLVPFRKSEEPL
jgi:hypothetical protein